MISKNIFFKGSANRWEVSRDHKCLQYRTNGTREAGFYRITCWYKAAYARKIIHDIYFMSLKVLCARGSSWLGDIAQFLIHDYIWYIIYYFIRW